MRCIRIVLTALACVALARAAFVKYPYLQNLGAGSAVVRWETSASIDGRVEYGLSVAYGQQVSHPTLSVDHELTLTGLLPDTVYHYRAVSGSDISADAVLRTDVTPGLPFRFFAYGDNRSDSAAHQSVVDRMLVQSPLPAFAVNVADMTNAGTLTDYRTFFNVERELLKSVPLWPTVGNHDDDNMVNWYRFLALPGNERYYTMRYGNSAFHSVSLYAGDSYDQVSAQYAWLLSELAADSADPSVHHVFVWLHDPPYTTNAAHSSNLTVRQYLCPLFERFHVDIVFTGHVHAYERGLVNGVQYVTTGGGGAPLAPIWNAAQPWTQYRETTYEFTLVDVRGDTVHCRSIRPAGTVFDSFAFVSRVPDVAAVRIEGPLSPVDSGAIVAPRVKVRNTGNAAVSLDVRFDTSGGLFDRKPAGTLAPGESTVVTFKNWTLARRGAYVLRCSTELGGDKAPANDTASGPLVVNVRDAAVTRITAPGPDIDSGAVQPRAVVRNSGSVPATFSVQFDVGSYTSTRPVTALAPADSTELTFDYWYPARGAYTAACTVGYAGDQVAANDRKSAPVTVHVHDIGAGSIAVPLDPSYPGPLFPTADVRNHGTDREACTVTFAIPGSYTATLDLPDGLPPGRDTTLEFASWDAQLGSYTARCSSYLGTDQVASNNVRTKPFDVVPRPEHDVGTEQVLLPQNHAVLPPGSSLLPRATVANFGNQTETFRVRFAIGTAYQDEQTVSGLGPGLTAEKDFAPTVPLPAGYYLVRCSTMLGTDANPGNDRQPVDWDLLVMAAPVPVAPAEAETSSVDTLTFDWQDLAAAERYDLEVALDTGFSRLVWSVQTMGSDSAGPRLEDGEYYWRVRGRAGPLAGPWCATRQFVVYTGPPLAWRRGWQEVRSVPGAKPVKDGAWLAEDGPFIYAARGNRTPDFYEYNPLAGASGTWTMLESIPVDEDGRSRPPYKGCAAAADGAGGIYMVKGNNTLGFWRYDIGRDSWTRMPDVPAGPEGRKVKGGGDLAYVAGDTGFVFLLKGGRTEFYRFNTRSLGWDTLDDAPFGGKARYDRGSFLVHDGGRFLYAHQAKYTDEAMTRHHMFRFDVAARRWDDSPPGMPVTGMDAGRMKAKKSKDGGAGVWFGSKLYALKGGNTGQFFCYEPAPADSWREFDTIPSYGSTAKKRKVKAGGDIAAFGDLALFAFKGGKTYEFWRYVVPTPQASSFKHQARSGRQAGEFIAHRSSFIVTPSPLSSGWATLSYSLPRPGPVSVTVFDVAGRCVLGQSAISNLKSEIALDLRSLSAGVYLVRLSADGYNSSQRLVVLAR